jgi:type IV secretory pathway TrbD component
MTRPAAKSLNKPLLVLGIDRKLVGLAFLLAVTVGANDGGSKIAAVVLFLGLCVLGRRLTRKDPNIFLVLNQVRRQKNFYDPLKRESFRIQIQANGR